jgi:hypothetical protein
MTSSALKRGIVACTATVVAATALIAGADAASAATPPYEPDSSAVGTLTFYDASGNVVTNGRTDVAPFASYVVGSAAPRAGDAQANLVFANPDPNSTPVSWYREQVGLYNKFPLTTGPANLQALGASQPAAVGGTSDQTLDGFETDSVRYTATGYTNMVQVRLRTANSANQPTTTYDDADLLIDPGTHTWTQVYPTPTVTATAPAAPTGTSAVPGNASATVSWTAPTDNGGSAITGYDVQYSSDSGTTWTSASSAFNTSTATSETVTGLTNKTSYVFRVAAINAIGTGAYSAASTAVTPTAPTPPAPDSTTLSITAPASVKYGATATISGTLTDSTTRKALSGQTVGLYRRASSSKSFTLVKSVKTTSAGVARDAVKTTANEQYEWRYAATSTHKAATSKVKSVGAVQTVSIARTPAKVKAGKSIKIYGAVTPAGSGKISLQSDVKGKWRAAGTATIKRQKLPNGKKAVGYVFTVKLAKKGTYTYRVVKAATSTLLAGVSGKISARAS